MGDQQNWDWEIGEKLVTDLDGWKKTHTDVYDEVVSPDGEKMGAIVKDEEGSLTCCVNGSPWESTYEKVYSVKFSPDGRLACITMADDEWTTVVDGVACRRRLVRCQVDWLRRAGRRRFEDRRH